MDAEYPVFLIPVVGSKLQTLPSNLLLQVLCEMHPYSLLQLSRTSKRFRSAVMSRSSRFIWRIVLAKVDGLPPCPVDLTEPQYAHLAFDPYCDLCLLPRLTEIHWACRMKSCVDCVIQHFKSYVIEGFGEPFPYELYVPCITKSPNRVYFPKDIENFDNQRLHFFPDTPEEARFLQEREAVIKDRLEHEEACRKWQRSLNLVPYVDENGIARTKRKEAVIERLKASGWAMELASMDSVAETAFSRLRDVSAKRELTDRIWKKIEPEILEFMQDIRTQLGSKTWLKTLTERVASVKDMRNVFVSDRPNDEPQPCLADLCSMETFQSSLSLPSDQVWTEEIFDQLRFSMPGLVESWKRYTSNILASMLPLLPMDDSSPLLSPQCRLALATSFFRCTEKCRNPIGYPRILVHHCTTSTTEAPHRKPPSSEFHKNLLKVLEQQPWNINNDRIYFHPEASAAASVVLEAAGFDPHSTTARDMNKADFWFVCSFCSNGGGELDGLLVMSWDAAVAHSLNMHEGSMQITDWAILEPRCPVISGTADLLDMISFFTPDYACSHYACGEHLSFQAVPAHMRNKHEITYKDLQSPYEDCYRHLDAAPPKPIRIHVPNRS